MNSPLYLSFSWVLVSLAAIACQGPEVSDLPLDSAVRMAAEHGDADAQYALGEAYIEALTDAESEEIREAIVREVARWWLQAAEQGHADAQFNLGVMYATGEGVPEDRV